MAKHLLHLLLLAAILAGCAPAAGMSAAPAASMTPQVTPPPAATATSAAAVPSSPTAAPSVTPPAADAPAIHYPTNPPAEDWRDWPVIPITTATAVSTYARGLALGNDPRAFSKVGDCQSIKEVLMGVYDLPGRYTLSPENAGLQETIDNFRGSFDRDGQAVQGGFNAASVLSPMWANPDACQPGENPLQCEFRVHKPSIVIISLEVWWNGRTPERYDQYMRTIIEYALEKGVVPVLSTKADNVEGNHAINLATARLAVEYDLPLWNWWRAAQTLPNEGLDPTRPDGFHISKEAWTLRAATGLQALDAVYRGVTSAEPAEAAADPHATEDPHAQPAPEGYAVREGLPRTLDPSLNLANIPGQITLSLAARPADQLTPVAGLTLDLPTSTLNLSEVGTPAALDSPLAGKLYAPNGTQYVTRRAVNADSSILVLGAQAGEERDVQLPGTNVLDAAWSPDGKRVAVLTVNRSDYSGKWGRLNTILFTPANFDVQIMPTPQAVPGATASLNSRVLWSPDGQWLLISGTDALDVGYQINMQLIHIATRAVTDLTSALDLTAPVPLFITRIDWTEP